MSELADFVLNAFRQAGGIVEPPAYGAYDVLLPEQVARRWSVPAYQRLAFADEPSAARAGEAEDVTVVGYGHPLVDTLVEEARAQPACAQAYVDDVRLDKRGLIELARQALSLPNARLSAVPRANEAPKLCHYVRFNFKAALITDEKRERLVSVVTDVQAGFAAPELVHIEQMARLKEEPAFEHLPAAPVRWLPGGRVLDRPVLEGLLERATRAALDELAAPVKTLRHRAARFRELDRARLTEYYDDIARDLQRRIDRASDAARRTPLEDKLIAAQAERQAKLADVEAKYRMRVELDLINLQVIAQPKILLPVYVGNRSVKIQRTIVWDPLLHRIEPLACDVCGQIATRLTLCSGGHLAHEDCLLEEQCVDCKRVYCRLCEGQMGRCAVCDRPVCVHSLNRCAECGRATCREHVGLCHAADGQPARPAPEQEAEPPLPPEPAPPPIEKIKKKPTPTPAPQPARKKKPKPTARTIRRTVKKPRRAPTPDKIEVYADPSAPEVDAFVLSKGKKPIAIRSWELTNTGIFITCQCEKRYRCPVSGTMLDPPGDSDFETLIEEQIDELRREYGVPARRVFRYAFIRGAQRQVPRVVLRGAWKR